MNNNKPMKHIKSIHDLVHQHGCTPFLAYKCKTRMPINGRVRNIDWCIADIVAALNAADIATIRSCCGHGNEAHARIGLADGRVLHVSGHTPNNRAVED